MMVVTLEEMKQYLRVDYEDDDQLIAGFIVSAEQLCRDILRADETADLEKDETVKTAVLRSHPFPNPLFHQPGGYPGKAAPQML